MERGEEEAGSRGQVRREDARAKGVLKFSRAASPFVASSLRGDCAPAAGGTRGGTGAPRGATEQHLTSSEAGARPAGPRGAQARATGCLPSRAGRAPTAEKQER